MKKNKLKQSIQLAVDEVLSKDAFLIKYNVSEWAIAHRLAVYLEKEFKGWSVDCEYNRVGEEESPKRISPKRKARPDICIHKRGKTRVKDNLLVIEVKKADSEEDFKKLKKYTSKPSGAREFQYQFGLAITFCDPPAFAWFSEGKKS